MVESVTPSYYAAGETNLRFEVLGTGFDNLPNDLVGWGSYQNSDPMIDYDVELVKDRLELVEKTDTRMVFQLANADTFAFTHYLGVIARADRSKVYWVNESQPIP